MAGINKIGFSQNRKIANPFKTSRSMSTPNPFKYSNFEGNTLPFADVFEGFEQKNMTNGKMRMISASVAGSMNKIKSLLPESIVNFVNRVRENVSNAWNYAKNTNISDIKGFRTINNIMNMDIVDLGKGISSSVSNFGKDMSEKMSLLNIKQGISDKMSLLNNDVTEIGKGLSDKWHSLISSINHKRINKDTSVAELKCMWLDEIALSNKEAK